MLLTGAACRFYLFDLLLVSLAAVIGGMESGVLSLVSLRCVLGLFARTRGFVGLVVVVTVGACGSVFTTSAPSVLCSSPHIFGNGPPSIMMRIAFLISWIVFFSLACF